MSMTTLATEILIPITLIAAVPMTRDIYRGIKTHDWSWFKERMAAGTKYMEEKEKLKSDNAEKERLKNEKESSAK